MEFKFQTSVFYLINYGKIYKFSIITQIITHFNVTSFSKNVIWIFGISSWFIFYPSSTGLDIPCSGRSIPNKGLFFFFELGNNFNTDDNPSEAVAFQVRVMLPDTF